MNDLDSLLYPLFDYLRRAAVPIGVGDYLLALKTLRTGQGIESLDRLQFTCKLLWAKSQEDQELIDQAFTRLVAPHFQRDKQTPPLQLPVDLLQRPRFDDRADNTNSENRSTIDSKTDTATKQTLQEGKVPLNPGGPASTDNEMPKAQGNYQLIPRLPITKREMTGIWRHLRQMGRSGPPSELDVEGTIDAISRDGFLRQPLLRALRQNQSRLLLLVDRQGSMAPFMPLVDALIESIHQSGLANRVHVYYFHNCPVAYLATHPGLIQYQSIETIMATYNGSVLIISDAGAARGTYRYERVKQTQTFLATLQHYTYLIAWINPLPSNRWRRSTASHIAELVPMFSLNRNGLIDAVNILRGRPVVAGVSSHD
jgi:uncharacterized protein with von Willebrand factor type A (vWA) domain